MCWSFDVKRLKFILHYPDYALASLLIATFNLRIINQLAGAIKHYNSPPFPEQKLLWGGKKWAFISVVNDSPLHLDWASTRYVTHTLRQTLMLRAWDLRRVAAASHADEPFCPQNQSLARGFGPLLKRAFQKGRTPSPSIRAWSIFTEIGPRLRRE